MPSAADYVAQASPVAAMVQAAGGQVGLTAEPVGPLEGEEAAAWYLRDDPRRRDWNLNMSRAAAIAGLEAESWVIHSYRLSDNALNGTSNSKDWATAMMLYGEASLLNAREYVTRHAREETAIWLTEYGASAPCMPWPGCPFPPTDAKSVWFRDAIYSPVHAFALVGNLVHAMSTPSARITAANLHSVFGTFASARGLVEIVPGAGPDGSDSLNVSVLAQVFAHFFAVAKPAESVRGLSLSASGPRLALNWTVARRHNFSVLAGVGLTRGQGVEVQEDFVLLNRGTVPVELELDVRGAGIRYRVASYASDAPVTTAAFCTIDPAQPPAMPWSGPMPVDVSACTSTTAAALRLSIAPLSMVVLEEGSVGPIGQK